MSKTRGKNIWLYRKEQGQSPVDDTVALRGKMKSTFYWLCPMINSCRRAISLYHAVIGIDYCLHELHLDSISLFGNSIHTHALQSNLSLYPPGLSQRGKRKNPTWRGKEMQFPSLLEAGSKHLRRSLLELWNFTWGWWKGAIGHVQLQNTPEAGTGGKGVCSWGRENKTSLYFLWAGGGLSCTVNSRKMLTSYGFLERKIS